MEQSSVHPPQELPRLLSMTLNIREFSRSWQHCDSLSNFLGRAVSADKKDSFRYENMVSTVINEVLEALYHNHGSEESAELGIGIDGSKLEFSIIFVPDRASSAFYEEVARSLSDGNVQERYEKFLLADKEVAPGLAGFLEIASTCDARVSISTSENNPRMSIAVILDMDRLLKE
ncbi:MAG TPA: hypothetical protein VMV83_04995 [Rectinemataceae bacterium]|nr:hypothetical protein [Rectinemataceae bacterium]